MACCGGSFETMDHGVAITTFVHRLESHYPRRLGPPWRLDHHGRAGREDAGGREGAQRPEGGFRLGVGWIDQGEVESLARVREPPHDPGGVASHDMGAIEHAEFDEVLAQHRRDGPRALDEDDAQRAPRQCFDPERPRAAEEIECANTPEVAKAREERLAHPIRRGADG